MASVYLLLGGNQGDRLSLLNAAKAEIKRHIGLVKKESSVYETEPWGFKENGLFLNQLLKIETNMKAEMVLDAILNIENKLGRKRSGEQWEGRTIDIDILFYNKTIVETETLTIPHPRLHLRRFALEPLAEIAKNLKHPILGKSMRHLLTECTDKQKVEIFTI